MTPPVRHLSTGLAAILAAAAVLSLGVAAAALRGALRPAAPDAAPPPSPPAAVPAPPAADALAALGPVLAPPPPAEPGALSRRFRLAGTILGGSNGGAADPMAILDDRVEVRQRVVSRGREVAPGIALVRVTADSATLAGPDGEETLALERVPSRAAPPRAAAEASATAAPDPAASAAPDDERARAAARFGGREDFPGRWIYSRAKVEEYYQELRAEPERMLQIFDSMDPVWVDDEDGTRRIDGYVVGVEGEPDLFAAAGLRDGDVVKSVNGLPMTRRDRAEAMIAAFVEGRGTMFAIEIERDGQIFKEVVDFE